MRMDQDFGARQAETTRYLAQRPRVAVARLENDAQSDAQWMWDLVSAAGAIVVLMASISLALASF